MKKETRKFITYYMPGSFVAETVTERVNSFDIPKSVPLDCYAFKFHSTEFVIDGKKEFAGDTKQDKAFHLIGKPVPASQLPQDDQHRILRSNIECNSPTKRGVLTHLGNWQMEDKHTVIHDPKSFTFTKPLIWKNIKSTATP